MKAGIFLATPLALAVAASAQTSLSDAQFTVIERGPFWKTWVQTVPQTNPVTGVVVQQPVGGYVELGNGMHVWENGAWVPSRSLIELTPTGAAAVHGHTKTFFSGNINIPDGPAVRQLTASGQSFQTQPVGLHYFDAASGQSVLLAPLQDSVGLLVPPNRVVYTNAFGDLADLVYVYATNGFEQLVVLRRVPAPPPAQFLHPRLEVWTAFNAPAPREQRPVVLKRETDPVLRQTMAEPDLVDHILIFDDCFFPLGSAFVADSSTLPAPGQPAAVTLAGPGDLNQLYVAKKLVQVDGQTLLVESVDLEDLLPRLSSLEHLAPPTTASGVRQLLAQKPPTSVRCDVRTAPAGGRGRIVRSAVAALGKPAAGLASPPMAVARQPYQPRGLVLDYTTLSGSTNTFTFTNGVTYFLNSGFSVGPDSTTFQPNVVVKGSSLLMYGPVSFPSSTTLFTAKDDNANGQVIANSTGRPWYGANPALWLYYENVYTAIQNVVVHWAQAAIEEDENTGVSVNPLVAYSTFDNCSVGVKANVGTDTLTILDCGQCSVATPVVTNTGTVNGSISANACGFGTPSGFPGLTGARTNAYAIVADTDGAAGPTNFVEIVNKMIAVYDKSTGNQLASLYTTNFFAVTNAGILYPIGLAADPRVLYDRQSGCWIACAKDTTSEAILFSYTTNSSPLPLTNAWTKQVLFIPAASDSSDSPTLGVDSNGVYVSALLFINGANTNGPSYIDTNIVICLPKPGIYQGSTNAKVLYAPGTGSGGLLTWKVQVAINLDSAPLGGWAWCVAKELPVTNGTYWPGTNYYRRIQWSSGVASWVDSAWQPMTNLFRFFDFDSNAGNAPGAPQLGGSFTISLGRTGSRLQPPFIRNGFLWTCQHVGLDNANGSYGGGWTGSTVDRSGIQWWKFQLSSTGNPLSYSASGLLYDNSASNPWWYYMPSVAVNSNNVILVGFSGSNPSNYISAFYSGVRTDGTTILPPIVTQSGNAYFTGSWGDYSFTTVDPTDNRTLWTIQGFANDVSPYPWGDWIVSVLPSP